MCIPLCKQQVISQTELLISQLEALRLKVNYEMSNSDRRQSALDQKASQNIMSSHESPTHSLSLSVMDVDSRNPSGKNDSSRKKVKVCGWGKGGRGAGGG